MVEAGYAQRHRFEKQISRREPVFQLTDEGAKAAVMPDEELNPYDFPLAYVQMQEATEPQITIEQLERHIDGLQHGTPLSAGPREFETELASLAIVGLKASEDGFISPFPSPTAHQREIAEVLIEECAEVTQRATKLLRFGIDEVQPGQPLSNRQRLSREIGDLQVMIESAIAAGIADAKEMEIGKEAKRQQLARFLQTQSTSAPTPVTPILIEAPNVYSLREEGYEVHQISGKPADLGIPDDDDGPTGDAIVDAWEPPKPKGDGWILHFKGLMEDGES